MLPRSAAADAFAYAAPNTIGRRRARRHDGHIGRLAARGRAVDGLSRWRASGTGAFAMPAAGGGGFRSEGQPRRQHWFLNEKSGFPFRTPAFCSVSRGQRRLGEKEYRAPSVTPGVALRDRTQAARLARGTAGKARRQEPPRQE